MNQIEMLSTLIDAARQTPDNRHLAAAVKTAEKRLDALRARKRRRDGSQQARRWTASCIECGQLLRVCNCWDHIRQVWLHAPKDFETQTDPFVIPCFIEKAAGTG